MTKSFLFGLLIGAIALPFSGAKAETLWHIVSETCIQMTCKNNDKTDRVLFDNSKDCMKAAQHFSDREKLRVLQLKIAKYSTYYITTTCRPNDGA